MHGQDATWSAHSAYSAQPCQLLIKQVVHVGREEPHLPPTPCLPASIIVQATPWCSRAFAAASPAIPPPITATRGAGLSTQWKHGSQLCSLGGPDWHLPQWDTAAAGSGQAAAIISCSGWATSCWYMTQSCRVSDDVRRSPEYAPAERVATLLARLPFIAAAAANTRLMILRSRGCKAAELPRVQGFTTID